MLYCSARKLKLYTSKSTAIRTFEGLKETRQYSRYPFRRIIKKSALHCPVVRTTNGVKIKRTRVMASARVVAPALSVAIAQVMALVVPFSA